MTKVIDTTEVTQEQINRCSRAYDIATKIPFYMVLSETDNLTEYKVEAKEINGEYRYTCTCPSGKYGFWNVKHPSGTCKHARWSLAHAKQFKASLKALINPVVEKIADSVPAWILSARVAPHMKRSPKELSR